MYDIYYVTTIYKTLATVYTEVRVDTGNSGILRYTLVNKVKNINRFITVIVSMINIEKIKIQPPTCFHYKNDRCKENH